MPRLETLSINVYKPEYVNYSLINKAFKGHLHIKLINAYSIDELPKDDEPLAFESLRVTCDKNLVFEEAYIFVLNRPWRLKKYLQVCLDTLTNDCLIWFDELLNQDIASGRITIDENLFLRAERVETPVRFLKVLKQLHETTKVKFSITRIEG